MILNKVLSNDEYKVEEVVEWLKIDRIRTRTLLKMLVAEGKILETGVSKMKRYKIGK